MRALILLTSALALQLVPQTPLVPPAPPPGTLPPLSCSLTIHGSAGIIDGNYPCASRVVYDSAKQVLEFTLTLSPPGSGSVVRIVASISAPQAAPRGGTFTLGTGTVTGDVTLKETAGRTAPVWTAGKSASSPLVGQTSLNLDDLGTPPAAAATVTTYRNPSGSIAATLEPQQGTGANGEVVLQLTFAPKT